MWEGPSTTSGEPLSGWAALTMEALRSASGVLPSLQVWTAGHAAVCRAEPYICSHANKGRKRDGSALRGIVGLPQLLQPPPCRRMRHAHSSYCLSDTLSLDPCVLAGDNRRGWLPQVPSCLKLSEIRVKVKEAVLPSRKKKKNVRIIVSLGGVTRPLGCDTPSRM